MKLTGQIADKGLHAFDHEARTDAGVKIPRIWCLVADKEKAHFYRKTRDGIERIAEARVHHDSAAGSHHHGGSNFIRNLAKWVDAAAVENAFDRLILVAGPRTLGDIRADLGKAAAGRISAEVPEDLTKFSDKQVEEHLHKMIWL